MITQRVTSEAELREVLGAQGLSETDERTKTGTFWVHEETRQHLLVPFSVQGFYPDWLLGELLDRAAEMTVDIPRSALSSLH